VGGGAKKKKGKKRNRVKTQGATKNPNSRRKRSEGVFDEFGGGVTGRVSAHSERGQGDLWKRGTGGGENGGGWVFGN